MDPYLERHWGDVHARLIVYTCDQLQGMLPMHLRARIEERVYFETPDTDEEGVFPDIRVVEEKRAKGSRRSISGTAAVTEPLVVVLSEPVTETFIEVRDMRSNERVVSVIEMLSPSNKRPGEGKDKYLEKRRQLCDGEVSLVEIDLLRAGKRLFPFPLEYLPESYRTPYNIWVRRGWDMIRVDVYAVPLRQRLPIIKVPLRETDEEIPLDLQPLLEQAYRNGGYDDDIDYEKEPIPPFAPVDARWADALLREKGLRKGKSLRRGGRNGKRRKAD
jgi:hypothetical protein